IRPMGRILEPLRRMGAAIEAEGEGERAPLAVRPARLTGIEYRSPVASAQVKSCLLLAGLSAEGRTAVHEPAASRDHTERILPAFGIPVERLPDGAAVTGGGRPRAAELTVPGDLSSAAFFLVAAALAEGSRLTVEGVGVNPTRTGVLDCLEAMGAEIERLGEREQGGEPVADLVVRGRGLAGIEIGGELMVRAIDEFPVLAVAACFAEGETLFRDAAELRVKESDRIAAMAEAIRAIGGEVEERPDGLVVHGRRHLPGGRVRSHGDHRVAMAMAVAAARCTGPVVVRDTACVDTSFPGFYRLLRAAAEA
ncbi:MAG: 3-phosphoshikimate 1-carboxyvinyltransferase, partial [Nitrospirae bacterium]